MQSMKNGYTNKKKRTIGGSLISFELGDMIVDPYDMQLYVNRRDIYATQSEYGYIRQFKELSDETIEKHLNGDITIGSYQMEKDDTVTWLCIDIDAHGDDEIVKANVISFEVFCRLSENGIPFVVESSGSEHSYHFWIFLVRTKGVKAYYFGRELLHGLNVEVYPKQPELTELKQFGNLVKLPFGINRKNGSRSRMQLFCSELRYIDINNYDESEYINKLSDERQAKIGTSTGVLPTSVRRCMRACATGEIKMTGTSGHLLRCALVPELKHGAGYTREQVTECFKYQSDFDYMKTLYMVDSLWNYNRFTCNKLKTDAYDKIGDYCNGCDLNG